MRRYGFAQVNPLLADVAAVDGGVVRASATPARMELPAERVTIRVEPLTCACYCPDPNSLPPAL